MTPVSYANVTVTKHRTVGLYPSSGTCSRLHQPIIGINPETFVLSHIQLRGHGNFGLGDNSERGPNDRAVSRVRVKIATQLSS